MPPGLRPINIVDPKTLDTIVVVTNYTGLCRHIKAESDLFIKDALPLKSMVQRYQKKQLRAQVCEHILLLDLASKPHPWVGKEHRALECVKAKVIGQTAQHHPVAVLVNSHDSAEMRQCLYDYLMDHRIVETKHCS